MLPRASIHSTDSLGRFSINYFNDTDSLKFLFVGYQELKLSVKEVINNPFISLKDQTITLQEVEIKGRKYDVIEQFDNIRSGKQVLRKDAILQLPAIAREPDFIKALTLLPGATKGIEGTSDFFVRGGAADQNLVSLDGATVYNTGHLFGFVSVFNPSAIDFYAKSK